MKNYSISYHVMHKQFMQLYIWTGMKIIMVSYSLPPALNANDSSALRKMELQSLHWRHLVNMI